MNKKEVYIPFGLNTLYDAIKMAIIRKKVDQEKIMEAISWPIAKIMV